MCVYVREKTQKKRVCLKNQNIQSVSHDLLHDVASSTEYLRLDIDQLRMIIIGGVFPPTIQQIPVCV